MDKRRTRIDREQESALRDEFERNIREQRLSIAEAVKAMRRLSRLTQPEFAKHRGVSLDTLKKIEYGRADPKVSTLNKIADIFALQVKFVEKK